MAIDLNADLGEGFGRWTLGDDAALLEVVTSANVACGFHAGDPTTLRRTCEAAVQRGVRIGAHVGYRDLAGFGRRRMDVPAEALGDDVTYQLGALAACAARAGGAIGYVKPHGALYHRCVEDPATARAVLGSVAAFSPGLPVMGPPGSTLLAVAAELGLEPVAEGFADRAYTARGGLVERGEPGAVLAHDAALDQARAIASGAPVTAADGGSLRVPVRTLCVHGDTPGAVALARAIRAALEDAGIAVSPFC
jgi:UPF0271 protein